MGDFGYGFRGLWFRGRGSALNNEMQALTLPLRDFQIDSR